MLDGVGLLKISNDDQLRCGATYSVTEVYVVFVGGVLNARTFTTYRDALHYYEKHRIHVA